MKDNYTVQTYNNKLLNHLAKHDLDKHPLARGLSLFVEHSLDDNESIKALVDSFIEIPLDDEIEPELEAAPKPRTLSDFMKLPDKDPNELIKDRFLCKGGGMLLIGPTGIGKSSLSMQCAINFALGKPAFGMTPVKPLKSLIIQAENDDGDVREQVQGVLNGLNLSEQDVEKASDNITIVSSDQFSGLSFFKQVLEPNLKEFTPDIVWIDPVLAYLGGDVSDQKVVGPWLRNGLNPLIHKYNCAAVLIHHTKKQTKLDEDTTDLVYLGMGSAEWANWARASIVLRKINGLPHHFKLTAGKRGGRLFWKEEDNTTPTSNKYLAHSQRPGIIFWCETKLSNVEELQATCGKSPDSILKLVPETNLIGKEELLKACQAGGMGRDSALQIIKKLIDTDELKETKGTRKGVKPKILFGLSSYGSVPLDTLTCNSVGHYIPPCSKPANPANN